MADRPHYYGRLDNKFLDSIELSVRADRLLRDWGRVQSMEDFMSLKRSEIMALKGAGEKTWKEVREVQTALRANAAPAPRPTREAGVFTARGIVELRSTVNVLANEGYQIVTVIDTQNGDYHVVAQKEHVNG